jgi:hypothetical protein
MRPLIPLTLVAAVVGLAACQTPTPPPSPATSSTLVGPAPRPGVLQRAHDGKALYPAKEGAGGHDHHHHHHGGMKPTPAPAPGASR